MRRFCGWVCLVEGDEPYSWSFIEASETVRSNSFAIVEGVCRCFCWGNVIILFRILRACSTVRQFGLMKTHKAI